MNLKADAADAATAKNVDCLLQAAKPLSDGEQMGWIHVQRDIAIETRAEVHQLTLTVGELTEKVEELCTITERGKGVTGVLSLSGCSGCLRMGCMIIP